MVYRDTFAGSNIPRFVPDPDASLEQSIASLCNRVEALAPGCKTGVCIANAARAELRRAIFPNVPDSFQACIKKIPIEPPCFGSCTAAMHGNTIITCHDMSKESRFDERFVQTCVRHGIHALQSRPVYGRDQKPIGTFVMSFGEPREVNGFDAALMAFAADAVGALLQDELEKTPGP
jgi:hypothetical protein